MLIKIENGIPTGYPVLEENFRYLYPSEVFPLILTNAIVEPFGYAMYDFSPQPNHLWPQELVEATPVKDEFGIWRQTWEVRDLTGASLTSRIASRKAELERLVDRDVDQIYGATIGNRATEYTLAESEARAYISANYTGPVPVTVQEWADVKGWTTRQAADDVVNAANTWRTAQLAIRKQRLSIKDQIRNASQPAVLDTTMSEWSQFVAYIATQLG